MILLVIFLGEAASPSATFYRPCLRRMSFSNSGGHITRPHDLNSKGLSETRKIFNLLSGSLKMLAKFTWHKIDIRVLYPFRVNQCSYLSIKKTTKMYMYA